MDSIQTIKQPRKASDLAGDFAEVWRDTSRQFFEPWRAFTQAMANRSIESGRFVVRRLTRTTDSIGRLSKCSDLPDFISIEIDWLHGAMDDYLQEASKMAAMNTNIVNGFASHIK